MNEIGQRLRVTDSVTAVTGASEPSPGLKQAIDVEQLVVWTYGLQQADLCLGTYDPWRDKPELSWMVRVQEICRLGTVIDTGDLSAYNAPVAVADDAMTVHGLALTLVREKLITANTFHVIVEHGRRRSRPDWMAGAVPKVRPVLETRGCTPGKPKIIYVDRGKRCGYCPIEWTNPVEEIEAARVVYRRWHAGLRILGAGLREHGLGRFKVIGPAAPETPWLTHPQPVVSQEA